MHEHDLEILDLVNDQDEVIGQIPRSRIDHEGIHNNRVINAFIKNDRGQLWIPRRVATKRSCPLALDVSVGGYVMSGETYDQALFRETIEEVRLDLQTVPYQLLAKFTPKDDGVYAFQQVYEIAYDADPDYNQDDFVEAYWLFPEDVMQRIKNGDSSKSDLPKLIKKIYLSPMAG